MDELEPTVVYLQNQRVGWNTNGVEYKAQYEASYAIFLGENVSPKTDVAPYEIWNNGSIFCMAETHITLSKGFHAKAGSEFHAQIGYVGYSPCTDGKSSEQVTTVVNDTYKPEISSDETVIESDNKNYIIAPNPSIGEQSFQILSSNSETLTIRLFDLSGKQIYWGRIQANTNLSPDLQSGVYIVIIDNGTSEQIEKLVIQ
ncbi:MAG: T9SS type A sorting domain-containing protein [Crocinitomicaceae bacterium]|nr:T9SS type A sorting domain-containing protein [Crocinitomicaceae bacterium]